jgi:hypothetical protein
MPQYMLLIYTPVDGPPAGTDPRAFREERAACSPR